MHVIRMLIAGIRRRLHLCPALPVEVASKHLHHMSSSFIVADGVCARWPTSWASLTSSTGVRLLLLDAQVMHVGVPC
jgi:hypothetical protein